MQGVGTQLEQIQLLIDKIQHHLIHNASFNLHDYEKLLLLSTQIHYPYGKALAHVFLAQYAQVTLNTNTYHAHLDEAKGIARSKNYFDILIKCAQLEGNHHSRLRDEMAALSNYLEGLTFAMETKDRKSCYIFYKEIAELFSDCGAYEEAQVFHQKALDVLEEYNIPESNFYRKNILIYLLRIATIQGDLAKAEQYWNACLQVPCELGNLPLLVLVEELRLLLLRGDEKGALQKAQVLNDALSENTSDALLLLPVYLYAMELLMEMKQEEFATWCLRRIDECYPEIDRKSAIRLQKLRVQYAETFGTADDSVYQNFYEVAQQSETANRIAKAETFRSLISLYETANEQNRMMEERTDLQSAIDRDELTQIYNYRYFMKLTSKFLQDDRVSSLACIIIDIDFFKQYNDHYGHILGDQALKEVASLLTLCLPQGAYAIRYGGDEFLCLFVDCSESELIDFVERVRSELETKKIEHVKNENGNLLTLSFGVFRETDLKNCGEQQLLSYADQALYKAKESGRNTYNVYTQGGNT